MLLSVEVNCVCLVISRKWQLLKDTHFSVDVYVNAEMLFIHELNRVALVVCSVNVLVVREVSLPS